MSKDLLPYLREENRSIMEAGLYKSEHILATRQGPSVRLKDRPTGEVLNFCANNYLGLSGHPALVDAAKAALDRWGYGMSSVRFICGTQSIHKELEVKLSRFLATEDAVLYSSCFDANTGLFETILGEEDAVISDALNHASIIDGIRLCKARRLVYANNDMAALEARLKEARECRFRLVVTDGVFSMDGLLPDLEAICDLAERYDALVMVDDSHGLGVLGETGAGSPEHWGVRDRIDIVTGTLGKALGGASGGFTATRREIAERLRQRSRPYLFSNSIAPVIAATSIMALDMVSSTPALRESLRDNAAAFRKGLTELGFDLVEGIHPIIPVMLGDARLAQEMAAKLLEEGIYVVGFSYPVVPQGAARIRTQMSAAHTGDHVERAVAAFAKVGRELGIVD